MKLLGILFLIRLYAQINIFKNMFCFTFRIMFSFIHRVVKIFLKRWNQWKNIFLELKTNLPFNTVFCIRFLIFIHSVNYVSYWETCQRIDGSCFILVIIYRCMFLDLITKLGLLFYFNFL